MNKIKGFAERRLEGAYPYLDGLSSGSAEPVPVRTEDQGVDDFPSTQSVEVLAFIQVPQHSVAILRTEQDKYLTFFFTCTAITTFPPEAQSDPSGETVTQLR